jgi:hypothetical protein
MPDVYLVQKGKFYAEASGEELARDPAQLEEDLCDDTHRILQCKLRWGHGTYTAVIFIRYPILFVGRNLSGSHDNVGSVLKRITQRFNVVDTFCSVADPDPRSCALFDPWIWDTDPE